MNDTSFSTDLCDRSDEIELVSQTPALDYSTITACSRPTARALLSLTEYWRSKCIGGPLPRREAIDPAEITAHLPWMFMADVVDGGADYRYRLIGTSIVSANYRDVTGRSFRELYSDPIKLDAARIGFDLARETGAPAYTTGRAFWRPDWTYDHFEAAFLPLCSDGRTVNIILGEITYLTPL